MVTLEPEGIFRLQKRCLSWTHKPDTRTQKPDSWTHRTPNPDAKSDSQTYWTPNPGTKSISRWSNTDLGPDYVQGSCFITGRRIHRVQGWCFLGVGVRFYVRESDCNAGSRIFECGSRISESLRSVCVSGREVFVFLAWFCNQLEFFIQMPWERLVVLVFLKQVLAIWTALNPPIRLCNLPHELIDWPLVSLICLSEVIEQQKPWTAKLTPWTLNSHHAQKKHTMDCKQDRWTDTYCVQYKRPMIHKTGGFRKKSLYCKNQQSSISANTCNQNSFAIWCFFLKLVHIGAVSLPKFKIIT